VTSTTVLSNLFAFRKKCSPHNSEQLYICEPVGQFLAGLIEEWESYSLSTDPVGGITVTLWLRFCMSFQSSSKLLKEIGLNLTHLFSVIL
jgi:hypothetical protein